MKGCGYTLAGQKPGVNRMGQRVACAYCGTDFTVQVTGEKYCRLGCSTEGAKARARAKTAAKRKEAA